MTEERRIELTEFVNDNLTWECDPELVSDIVDLIEMKVKEDTLSIVERVVEDEKRDWDDKDVINALDWVLTRIKNEIGE